MDDTRRKVSACAVAFGLALAAAVHVLGASTDQCDNMAGTCIHERQRLAIAAIRTVCVLAVVVPIVIAAMAVSSRAAFGRVTAGLLVLCMVVAIATLAVDPLPHLNNRWHGWLSGDP